MRAPFRSNIAAAQAVGFLRLVEIAGLTAFVVPFSMGLLLFGLTALGSIFGPIPNEVPLIAYLLVIGSLISIPVMLLISPVAVWTLRRGWAGWGNALLVGAAAGGIVLPLLGTYTIWAVLPGAAFGLIYAGLYWTGIAYFHPAVTQT